MSASASAFAAKLADSSLDLKSKLNCAIELRDAVELQYVTADYDQFVQRTLPEILKLLGTVPISMHASSLEHQLRHALLNVLSRLPANEILRRAAPEILRTVVIALQQENEENGIVCLRVFTNLYRSYKQQLLDQVKPFFDFILLLFKNIPNLVNERFSGNAAETEAMFPATASFKVLTECPIIIVLLYSASRQLVQESLPTLLPHVIELLSIEAAPQAKEHEIAASKGEIFTGVSPAIQKRAVYNDFITSQIKIMSFLAYTLRAYSSLLQNYYNLVPNFVIRLLKDCPSELSSARKELLVSMRHILSTDFRTYFIPKVAILLEERVLIGDGLTAQETLWPLAYSTMADLIHHVRNELSVAQIWKAVRVYSRNLRNNQLASSFQVMSAKLLLNFIERVMMLPDRQEGRLMMVTILRAFVDCFTDLNKTYLDLVDVSSEDMETDTIRYCDIADSQIIKLHPDSDAKLKDARYIFKNLMIILKTVMFGFKKCNPPPPSNIPPQQWEEAARGFNYDDVNLFRRLFREVITAQLFFVSASNKPTISKDKFDPTPTLSVATTKDEKELMEVFATVFIHVDPATFNEIVEAELEFFYQQIFRNNSLLHIAQLFLANETTSANFSGLLLRFLRQRLPEIGEGDPQTSNILLRLFKLCFMAVNLFPQTNEPVILLHFKDLIIESLKLASTATNPILYFHLLRALFRSIGGGRFEALYTAVLPLLQTLLEILNKRLAMASIPSERDVCVELCLTVPVRLSLLVPHLSYLMRPLVIALNGSPELVSQGLRTLELCVDNLTSSYFDPIIEPVMDDVMKALWKHLRPLPYNHQHSHTTLRILGKLGGRNRAFLKPPSDLKTISSLDQDISVIVGFKGLREDIPMRITPGVDQALTVLQNPNSHIYYKRESLNFLITVIKQFIPEESDASVDDLARNIRKCVQISLSTSSFENVKPLPDGTGYDLTQRNRINELNEKMLEAVFYSASDKELRDQAYSFIMDLCEQCALLELGECTVQKRRAMRPFAPDDHEGIPYIAPNIMVSAIFSALCHYNADVRELGREAICKIFKTGRAICGPNVESYCYPLVRPLTAKLLHGFFSEEFYRKVGACRTLKFLFIDLKFSPVRMRLSELIRPVLVVIKDVTNDSPTKIRDDAAELLYYLVRTRNAPLTSEQIKERPFILLSGLLAFELVSSYKAVREVSQKALQLLADMVQQPLTDILAQVTNVFLNPIFVKPLRALPFPMQIGYIDAISFCVELPNTFLDFADEKLTRLLEEVLALVDAEDKSLTSEHKLMEYTTSQQLIDLRVVCIKLLTLALTKAPDHFTSQKPQMKAKIIAVLLKTLSSSKKEVVDAAHVALKDVLALNPRPPRDILQNGLRPTLITLSDYQRLTVSGLDSLSRLLELFTNYFKVELGRKLLDHLKEWTKPLTSLSNKVLVNNEHIEKGVALLGVFQSLPAAAHVYIPEIMQVLSYVETQLRRVQVSPFREPVAKYLERFPQETFSYFQSQIANPRLGRIFCDLVAIPSSENLREQGRQDFPQLLQQVLNTEGEAKHVGVCNLIFLMKVLSTETWIARQKAEISQLLDQVEELSQYSQSIPGTLPIVPEISTCIETLQVVVVDYSKSTKQTELLFSLIVVLAKAEREYHWPLVDFLFEEVVCSTDVEFRNLYLNKSMDLFPESPFTARLFVMNSIVNPILQVEIRRNGDLSQLLTKVGSNGWLDTVHNKVWQRTSESSSSSTIDKCELALLEMSLLLVRSSSSLISDVRKSFIRFGWSFFPCEDVMSKICAYVLVSQFVASYDTFQKIVVQIYVALLKTNQVEAKTLVAQALDTLAPVLPTRINAPVWAIWPRRILVEEGHSISHVMNIYEFIARHPELFYTYRENLVPVIIAAMTKTYNSYVNIDVDLPGLLCTWEQMAAKDEGDNVYRLSASQREIVVTYLLRHICGMQQNASETPQGKKALSTLDTLISKDLWGSSVQVHLDYFDRSLMQGDLITPTAAASGLNALAVVKITLQHKSADWIRDNLERLHLLLERSLRCPTTEVHEALEPALKLIFDAADPENDDCQSFLRTVVSAIQDHLSAANAFGWIYLAKALINARPNALDSLMQGVIRALNKAAKELTEPAAATQNAPAAAAVPPQAANTQAGATANGQQSSPSSTAPPVKISIPLLIDALDLVAARISHLGDQRRSFLHVVMHLLSVDSKELRSHIVKLVRKWVFSRTEPFPTVKEKSALLLKMLADFTDRKDTSLLSEYYSIILEIFNDLQGKSELPAKLEHPFLVGCTLYETEDAVKIRDKLLNILSESLDPGILDRLQYVLMEQNWESISDHYWLNQGLQLMLDANNGSQVLRLQDQSILLPSFDYLTACFVENEMEVDEESIQVDDQLRELIKRRQKFVKDAKATSNENFIRPLRELQFMSNDLVHDVWVDLFPTLYKLIPSKDKTDMIQNLVIFLARDFHVRQASARPNVVGTILEGLAECEFLPPELVKYLCSNYGSWHAGMHMLERFQESPNTDSPRVSDCNLDALTELYTALQEDDMFYGLWRNRSKFIVTNSALSYEQCGMWSRAMQMHENAQIKARSGALPYGESEYGLWEDHWILCAEKLQHWDILTELAKHEGFNDLLLECGWRVADWTSDKEPLEQSIKSLMDAPTPRRQMFETFLCLQGFGQKTETLQNLSKCCDEGVQLALRKWHGLPTRITGAHIPLLHTFQQYVEFMETSQIYTSLSSTTALNLEHKSQELKGVLQAWHDRLPNLWDDINIWSDLVTWRQHVFGVINKVYLPLTSAVPANNARHGNSNSNNTAAYRGYHEIAWIINRFAHVARKHNMTDVCINLLSKIYTLPNIEVQEAFLKLREQAKCHYQNPNDVSTGLEVISNTNFAFFHAQQKSEFFTIRGMSLAKLGSDDRANEQFSTAVQIDVYLPKPWDEWGKFNDRKFMEHPTHLNYGATALSCYLQAAGLYKSAKARKILGRILWLLSLDDQAGTISAAFDSYRGDTPVWYWVTYVPQLLSSLAHKEARHTKHILVKIAKSFPQALHFHLRTAREEFNAKASAPNRQAQSQMIGRAVNQTNSPGIKTEDLKTGTPPTDDAKQPLQYVEEIMATLKTSYPLLTLSLETLVDQIYHRFKSSADEDAYRLIVALLNDAIQYTSRIPYPREDAKLPPTTEASLSRFAEGVIPEQVKATFEADFVHDKPNLEEYIKRLLKWRNRFEAKLDARPKKIHLESLSPPLSEFHYQKFEEVEVPGQNSELKDSNVHFVKIGRFLSDVDFVRGFNICYRRLTIRGHDGSTHPFAVQFSAGRHCRREERVTQLFKILNKVLLKRKESRSRYLQFTLPTAVPLTSYIRLVQDNSSYISMYQIYEKYCQTNNQSRDEPFHYTTQAMRAAFDPKLPKPDIPIVKLEILNRIQSTLVPQTIMKDFFTAQYRTFEDFWLFRKQFAYQYAGITFMTFMMSINNRYPQKFLINTTSGKIWATEMLPILPASRNPPAFFNGEPVPFRMTPNIQALMGATTFEGLYSMAVMIIAKGLTDPEFDLAYFLPVFVRDELLSWYSQQRATVPESQMRDVVKLNVDAIVKRAMSLGQVGQGSIPANQTVIDLISIAVNPRNLAMTDVRWMPYY